MRSTRRSVSTDLAPELVESYAINDRMNQQVLQYLNPLAWRAIGVRAREGRTVVAIFSHMHNVRRKWLRLSAPHLKLPAAVNRARCSQEEMKVALAESAARCCRMISDALVDQRVEQFHRDGWAKPWPAGAAMVAYMISHDAHHRGQVCMLAHQLGYPLPETCVSKMWAWERLKGMSGDCGVV